jgi:hypothetical protein
MGMDARYQELAPVQLIDAFNRRDWEAVGRLVTPDIVYEIVLSREVIRGRGEFVAFNRGYPGDWRITIDQVIAEGEQVVLRLTFQTGEQVAPAIIFFELRDGLIARQSDWWPEYYDPPAWRGERFQGGRRGVNGAHQ